MYYSIQLSIYPFINLYTNCKSISLPNYLSNPLSTSTYVPTTNLSWFLLFSYLSTCIYLITNKFLSALLYVAIQNKNLFICPSLYPSIHTSSISQLGMYLSIYLSIYLEMSIYLQSIYRSIYLSCYPSIHPFTIYYSSFHHLLFIYSLIYYLSLYLSIKLQVKMNSYLAFSKATE